MEPKPVEDIYQTPLFPYIEGDVLAELGKDIVLTIENVLEVELASSRGKEVKVVLTFKETSKALILNKVNAQAIWHMYGRKATAWRGKRVALYSESVSVAGKRYNAIRVRRPPMKKEKQHEPSDSQV